MEERLLHKAIHMADMIMVRVGDEDMEKPTPCSEWDVHMLINHLVYETAWIEPLLEGKTITEVGDELEGDLLGGRPYEAWHRYAAEALHAASVVDRNTTVHLSYGDKTAAEYMDEVAADIIIHAWDLAQALDVSFEIDDRTAQEVIDAAASILPMAKDSGLVGEAVKLSEKPSLQEKLLASYGRDINWSYAAHHHHARRH